MIVAKKEADDDGLVCAKWAESEEEEAGDMKQAVDYRDRVMRGDWMLSKIYEISLQRSRNEWGTVQKRWTKIAANWNTSVTHRVTAVL